MSDRIYINYRNPDAWSVQSALAGLSAEDIENLFERNMLLKYQDTLHQLNQKEQELYNTRHLLHSIYSDNDKKNSAVQKGLQESATRIASQIDALDRILRDLQEDPILKPLIDREKDKWRQREDQRGKEALERYREKALEDQRKLIDHYQKSRLQALQKGELAQQQQKQEPKKQTQTPLTATTKSEKIIEKLKHMDFFKNINITNSKRIAAVVSIVLCAILYLSFLTMAFTNERDTYICYTTKTGSCYHADYCRYISMSAYETTVYEASKEYRPCSFCNPCVERCKTTITVRNYTTPILISAPISIAVYLLLIRKKKT